MKLSKVGVLIFLSGCICVSIDVAAVEQDLQRDILKAIDNQTLPIRQIAISTAAIAVAGDLRSSGFVAFLYPFVEVFNLVAEDNALRFDTAHALDMEVSGNTDFSINGRINELSFSSLLGKPPRRDSTAQSPMVPAMQYLRRVVGFNSPHHFLPQAVHSSAEGKEYSEFVNSMVAIESFSAYVLSERYVDGGNQSALNQKVAHEITGQKWELAVASEPIASVQRQTLLFAARNYLQQARLIEIQRDLLTAQVMANSIALMNLKLIEKQRYQKLMSYKDDPQPQPQPEPSPPPPR